ncbi:hypothetical protein C0J52_22120 [Blattella germanica]|nr:hypothetical protein C0J52_22120 [Blattella germanica]
MMKRTQDEVCALFNETHPDRDPISQCTVSRIQNKFNEYGHVRDVKRSGRPSSTNEDMELDILLTRTTGCDAFTLRLGFKLKIIWQPSPLHRYWINIDKKSGFMLPYIVLQLIGFILACIGVIIMGIFITAAKGAIGLLVFLIGGIFLGKLFFLKLLTFI